VKENHFADALPVTLIEFDLPSHHPQPTEKASSIDALTFLASPFMSSLLAAQKTCFQGRNLVFSDPIEVKPPIDRK
jgi:hypothetical protein